MKKEEPIQVHVCWCIQLFRERLSERHCGWFWVHCSSEKFERIGTKVHGNMFASATVGSTATVVRNSVSIISHITFRDCRVHIFSDNLSRNSCIRDYKASRDRAGNLYLRVGQSRSAHVFSCKSTVLSISFLFGMWKLVHVLQLTFYNVEK